MIETLLIIYFFLFTLTSCIIFLYYRRIKEGSREYFRAKNVLDDIILSFNRDIQRQEEKIQATTDKSEKLSSENLQIREEINSKIVGIRVQLEELLKTKDSLLGGYEDLKKKVEEVLAQQSELFRKITEQKLLGEEIRMPETSLELAIPIRKERALGSLTETELKILELLAAEGEKTAPQIKEEVKLTREHTARLMKNLYVRGFIERKTDTIPYLYRLKNEMKDILKRQKTEI